MLYCMHVILPYVPVEKLLLLFCLTVSLSGAVSVTIAYILSRFTGLSVLAIYTMVQLADLIKCVIGFILVKKGIWLQNIVS